MDEKYLKGRGAQFNPVNKFSEHSLDRNASDGIDDYTLSRPVTQIFTDNPKRIISKNKSPDLKMMYSVNPYQGCEHGCIYCYARNSHQYWGFGAGTDFESKIMIKPNAARLLEKELQAKSWRPHTIMFSGNTDCYQPIERKYKLTRSLLKVLLNYQHPVGIITKNILIERDLDLLTELAKRDLVHVYFSITTLDESIRRVLEPRTATAKNKLKTMELLRKNEIPVGVMVAPIIPGLTHHEIPNILRESADAGALGASFTVVRLNGVIGSLTRDWLLKNMPDRADKIWNQVCDLHGGDVNDSTWGRRMSGSGHYANVIKDLFTLSYKKHFPGRSMPSLRTDLFRRSGNYQLF